MNLFIATSLLRYNSVDHYEIRWSNGVAFFPPEGEPTPWRWLWQVWA